jgi:hypothetical protein
MERVTRIVPTHETKLTADFPKDNLSGDFPMAQTQLLAIRRQKLLSFASSR